MRTEHRHHTDEQVQTILSKALRVVETLNVPPELRAVAFVQACGLYAQKSIAVEQALPLPHGMVVPRGGL